MTEAHAHFPLLFLEGDHIKAAETIEADAVGEAIDEVLLMLRERPQHRTVEIWEGGRKLYRGEEPVRPDRLENG